MTDLQRSILAISTALVILLAALILRSAGRQAERVRVAEAKTLFDPSSAFEKTKTLASQFPKRATGTEGSRAAANWIESELKKCGLRTEQQKFTVWIAGKKMEGRNVIGVHEGVRNSGVIALIAHYDIPYHVQEGAMDDASGVGVLLELARALSTEELEKTVLFIVSDSEEWGMLGARHFVNHYPGLDTIRAVLSLDYVRLETPEKIYLHGEGQFRGYAPLWLWLLAEDCISKAGGMPKTPLPLIQYGVRAVNICSTDQGPFNRAGVPAINLGGSKAHSPLGRKVYHTLLDTSENLKPTLFEVYGKAVESMVRSLDAVNYPTDDDPYYLRISRETYLGRSGLFALQIFLFLPLILAAGFQYFNLFVRKKLIHDAVAEFCNIALFTLPWVVALMVLYRLVMTNWIPRYELYPATALDPLLINPEWAAVAIIAGAFIVAWVIVCLLRFVAAKFFRRPDFAISKAVCLDILLALSVVVLLFNGFAATLFLAPAALLWGWIEQGKWPLRLAWNLILLLAAAVPLVLLTVMFSKHLMLGPYVLWYLLLGAGYKFFSPVAVLVAVAAATLGVRLVQLSFTEIIVPLEPEAEKK